nr:MAG TPA: hypothetical protein [Caudoviricetes sp.]
MKFLCFTAAAKKSRFFPWGGIPCGAKEVRKLPLFEKIFKGTSFRFWIF